MLENRNFPPQAQTPIPKVPEYAPESAEEREQFLVKQVEQTIREWIAKNTNEQERMSRQKLAALIEFIGEQEYDALEQLSADFDDAEKYTKRPSIMLYGAEGQDIPLISLNGWREGDQSSIHDHDISQAAYHIWKGNVKEEVFSVDNQLALSDLRRLPEGAPVKVRPRILETGQSSSGNTRFIHRVSNADGGLGISINGYYPPLEAMNYYEVTEDGNIKYARGWKRDWSE